MTRLLIAALLLLPSLALAEGVLMPAANPPDAVLYDYRNTIKLQEEFISGTTTTGNVGNLGWWPANGTLSYPASTTGRLGLARLTSTASINTLAGLGLQGNTGNLIDPSLQHRVLFIGQLDQVDANTTAWVGAASSFTLSSPVNGIWFERRDADTNWQCITSNADVETKTDSAVAAAVAYHTFEYRRTTANVQFFINGALVCTHTTNIPTVFIGPAIFITNSAASAKTFTLDYFELNITLGTIR